MGESDLKPEFDLKIFVKSIGIIVCTVAVVAVFLCFARWFSIKLGLSPESAKLFSLFVPVLEKCVWPAFVLLIIFLFRNNLNDAVNAAAKIRGGRPDDIKKSNMSRINDSIVNDEVPTAGRIQGSEFEVENYVFEHLQKETDALLMREVSIFGSRYSFDGAFRIGSYVYAVEIKKKASISQLKQCVARIDEYVSGLKKSDSNRFVLVLCLVDSSLSDDELKALRRDVDIKIQYREYHFDGESVCKK